MKLYYSTNLNPRVAVAAARHLKSPVEFIRVSPRDPRQEDAFRVINPNTLVPVLVEGDKSLWETDAIACRLSMIAGSDFWPTGDWLPETVKWLSWSKHHLTAAGDAYYFENIIKPKYLGLPPDAHVIEGVESDFHRYAKVLDESRHAPVVDRRPADLRRLSRRDDHAFRQGREVASRRLQKCPGVGGSAQRSRPFPRHSKDCIEKDNRREGQHDAENAHR